MPLSRRSAGTLLPLFFLAFSPVTTLFAQESFSDRDLAVHVLNRITFGPRPGDVEAVQKMGVKTFIEQQLHPENIDDSALDAQLAQFDLLQWTAPQLVQMYEEERKKGLKKAKEAADAAAQAKGQNPAMANGAASTPPMDPAAPGAPQPPPPGPRPPGGVAALAAKADENRSVTAIGQMEEARLVRDVNSNRQLQEVLVDFWGNHFNIDMKKNFCRILKVVDDREVIRPHIWGTFRELLGASAHSPAMLIYLDNATNTVARDMTPQQQQMIASVMEKNGVPGADEVMAEAQQGKPKKQGGINENYAREIMELHTLGVDGGYTQTDVQEVARCFTGWSINRQTGEFQFHAFRHDNGSKTVLGHVIPAGGGEKDGEMVLDILCAQPACAHFIAKEMCQRFVSDAPSEALVTRIAGVFTQTGGDLRKVTEAILTSPEFLSPNNYRNKIKSPLEFAVSAVRASQSTLSDKAPAPFDKIRQTMEGAAVLGRGKVADRIAAQPRQSLNWHIYDLGEPLFACTPPTGYKEVSSTWVSPGALIERLNFAMALTGQKISDVQFDAKKILAGTDLDKPQAVLDRCVSFLLQNNITDGTRKVLAESALPTAESQTVHPDRLIALILGSPEFQRK